jgi:hypothetical protein
LVESSKPTVSARQRSLRVEGMELPSFTRMLLLSAAGLDGWDALRTEGAVGGRDGRDFERGEGDARDSDINAPGGAINDGGRADDERARGP